MCTIQVIFLKQFIKNDNQSAYVLCCRCENPKSMQNNFFGFTQGKHSRVAKGQRNFKITFFSTQQLIISFKQPLFTYTMWYIAISYNLLIFKFSTQPPEGNMIVLLPYFSEKECQDFPKVTSDL